MFLVGLTGGIATGKSTVSRIFSEQLGVQVIDADVIAKQAVEPGKSAWQKIKNEFGEAVFKETERSGLPEVDRDKLGELVFNDRVKRQRLNEIIHPEVHRAIFWMVIKSFFAGYQFVVLDLPLLYESGSSMLDYIHKVIVVSCDDEQQLHRLIKRSKMTEIDARKRIQAQMPLDMKCERANYVIDNSGSHQETNHQVLAVFNQLRRSKRHLWVRTIFATIATTILILAVWLTFVFLTAKTGHSN